MWRPLCFHETLYILLLSSHLTPGTIIIKSFLQQYQELSVMTKVWRLNPWLGRMTWEGNGYPLQYYFLENSMDESGGYSPWGCKVLDTTEWLTLSSFFLFYTISYQRESTSFLWECLVMLLFVLLFALFYIFTKTTKC